MKSALENKSSYIIEVETIEPHLLGPKWTHRLAGLTTYAADFLALILFIPLLIQVLIHKYLYKKPIKFEPLRHKITISRKGPNRYQRGELLYEEIIPENEEPWTVERAHYHLQRAANNGTLNEEFIEELRQGKRSIFKENNRPVD